jgi:hypothetical protein
MRHIALAICLVACGNVTGDSDQHPDAPATPGPDAPGPDSDTTHAAACDLGKPFRIQPDAQFHVAGASEINVSLSSDELTAYFMRDAHTGMGWDIYMATRATTSDAFGAATPLSSLDSTTGDADPTFTGDALTVVFARDAGPGVTLLYTASRSSAAAAFGAATELVNINDEQDLNVTPLLAPDGLSLYFAQRPSSGLNQLMRATRANLSTPFGMPATVTELNLAGISTSDPVMTGDQLTMYFASDRNNNGATDIFKTERRSTADAWGAPVDVTELDSTDYDWPTWISADGCRMYFSSNHLAPIWYASKPPL